MPLGHLANDPGGSVPQEVALGLFRRKQTTEHVEAPSLPNEDAGETDESRAYIDALARGDLDEATVVLERCLAQGMFGSGRSLLDRCAAVCCALRDGQLDAAASDLTAWESPYQAEYFEPVQRARMNALGLCLMRYFRHPASVAHEAFNGLLDGKLRDLGKEAHRCGEPFFGDVFASIKSRQGASRL